MHTNADLRALAKAETQSIGSTLDCRLTKAAAMNAADDHLDALHIRQGEIFGRVGRIVRRSMGLLYFTVTVFVSCNACMIVCTPACTHRCDAMSKLLPA